MFVPLNTGEGGNTTYPPPSKSVPGIYFEQDNITKAVHAIRKMKFNSEGNFQTEAHLLSNYANILTFSKI